MFHSKNELADVLSILIYCPDDRTYLLLLDETRGDYWIPSTKMDMLLGWKDNLHAFKNKLFDYEIINDRLVKVFKIWTMEKEYFHLIFQLNLPKEIKTKCKTETRLGRVGWFTCKQISKIKPLLRSLEILEITHNYVPKAHKESVRVSGELVPVGCLTEVRECDVLVTPDNVQSQAHLDLLESARLPPSEQYGFYEQFFMCTYPCIYMNHISFKRALQHFHFSGDLENLFRAADAWKRDFLTFQDYLYLIAVMNPLTSHCGNLAEIRCQYIFRYYNENGDGKLNYRNFQNLITDMAMELNTDPFGPDLEKEMEKITKMINFNPNSLMSFEQFHSHILHTRIRDPTQLLRFSLSHFEIPTSEVRDSTQVALPKMILSTGSVLGEDSCLMVGQPIISQLLQSLEKFFKIERTTSIIRAKPDNQESSRTQKGEGNDCSDYSIALKPTILKPGEMPLQINDLKLLEETMTKSVSEEFKVLSDLKVMRLNSFDLETKINELLIALRYFCTEICQSPVCCGEFEFEEKEAYTWGSAYIEKLGITLIMMCEQMKEILKAEPRLLELDPPVYIMGDLHGNFHDLITFEKALWSHGIALSPAKFLFLGDYVDRGLNSVEVVMYLFATKIQNPNKFFLVRGNHEIREIQKMFTFQRECTFKFGNTLGMSIWKAVNEAFDSMPLAAIIDRKVFCCHGGIPPPWLCPVIAVINMIPCPLVNCEKQSPLAWTLMWNDPIRSDSPKLSDQAFDLLVNDGFTPNIQRGTAFAFNCDALERFLKTNNLSHVVRAHEVVRAGFQVHQKGKLLTVFSSSGYCGGNNYAGSVLVADKYLRVFMVDTGSD